MESLLNQIEQTTHPETLLEALTLLEKLIQNIVMNPDDPKYRMIKSSNATIQSKLFGIQGVEKLIMMLGYQPQEGNFVLPDETIGLLMSHSSSISFRRRLIAARMTSAAEYQKELDIINNQRAINRKLQKEAEEQEKLKKQADNDKKERKHMKADTSESRQLQFGTKATTWKDIGVDLCKKG